MKPEVKVGLFVFFGLLVLVYLTFTFGDIRLGKEKGYTVKVYFDTVSGLEEKAPVKIAGVDVGKVKEIRLKGTKAEVVLWIKEGVRIPKDAVAVIRTMGLMGEKYIEITDGSMSSGYVAEGGTIGKGVSPADMDYLIAQLSDIARDVKAVTATLKNSLGTPTAQEQIKEILANLQETTKVLAEISTSNEEKVNAIIANTERLTRELAQLIRENRVYVSQSIENFSKFSQHLPRIARNLDSIVSTLSTPSVRKELKTTIAEISETSKNLKEITSTIAQGKGTIGKLVKDEKVYNDLSETLETLKETTERVKRTTLTLEFKGDYMTRDLSKKYSYSGDPGNSYGYFTVRIQPREDRFYVLGITSDPRGDYDEKRKVYYVDGRKHVIREKKFDRKIKFTAQYGIRLLEPLDFRIGLKDSTAGIGFDYRILNNKDLVASLDVWDFSGEYSDHGDARVRIGVSYTIWKPFFIEAGWDDILNSKFSSFFVGAGMRITDEDLKYLLFGGGSPPIK